MRSREYHPSLVFFFFNDTAATEIYTLSLHDALPISPAVVFSVTSPALPPSASPVALVALPEVLNPKSTRLNSRHDPTPHAFFPLPTATVQPRVSIKHAIDTAPGVLPALLSTSLP